MKLSHTIAQTIRNNPLRATLGSFLWATLVAFIMSPGILFNLPSEELVPVGIKGGIGSDVLLESNTLSALVHAFLIAFLILPGQIFSLI